MKKVFSTLILTALLSVLIVPQLALATTGQLDRCTLKNTERINTALDITGNNPCQTICIFDSSVLNYNANCAGCCLMQTVFNITDWFFIILVALSAIFVLMGAFSLLFSGGDAAKIDTGRKYIIFAATGLAIGFLAKAIPSLVKMLIGA